MPKVLIAGASRGIGLGLVRVFLAAGWHVIATRRSAAPELERLAVAPSSLLELETLDLDDDGAISALHARLGGRHLDALVVNAAVSGPTGLPAPEVSRSDFAATLVANAYAPIRAAEVLLDRVQPGGVVAWISSVLGSITRSDAGGWETYRASKAALNSLSRSFVARHRGDGHAFLTLHPGWVRTDMGGPNAGIDVGTSAQGLYGVLTSRAVVGAHHFLDYRGEEIPW